MESKTVFRPQNIDIVYAKLELHGKKQLLEFMSEHLSNHAQISAAGLYARLLQKERDHSSGIGAGVAIPHAKILQLKRPVNMLITLDNPLNFDGADNKPVDLIYTILSPRSDGVLHLQRLSAVTRMMRDRDFAEKLRGAKDSESLRTLVKSPDGWMMAA